MEEPSGMMRQRQSNYELLRLAAGLAVILLHFNYTPGGGGALESARGATYYVLTLLEIVAVCAVNLFVLLSGYFSCDSKSIKTGKLLELLLQTMCFRLAFTVLGSALHHSWSIKKLGAALIPENYFVILYIVLMILAPFINKMIGALSQRDFTLLVILSFAAFSLYATMVDILKEVTGSAWGGLSPVGIAGSMGGYSIVNFALIYLIGAWLKRMDFRTLKTGTLIAALIGSVCILFVWGKILPGSALNYSNPILIIESCIIFLLFGRLKIESKAINKVAKASFSCFLIHPHILGYIGDRFIVGQPTGAVLAVLLIEMTVIYGLSIVVMLIWDSVTKTLFKSTIYRLPNISIG